VKPPRIAIVVLGCLSSPYDRTIAASRQTWGGRRVPDVEIYYLYGNPHDDEGRRVVSDAVGGAAPLVEDDAICQIGDVLIAGCAAHISQQADCLLRKRLRAFAYLAATDRYDLIYTVCATSYVDQRQLARYARSLVGKRLVAGVISITASTAPFVSGASMILSVEIARELGAQRQQIIQTNVFGHYDDVTIGHWIADRLSRIPLAAFIADLEARRPMTPGHIFVACPEGTIDYVTVPAPQQRPVGDAFHYHFNSNRAQDIVGFHERYYASGWPSPTLWPA
jgi:hypothetical protein